MLTEVLDGLDENDSQPLRDRLARINLDVGQLAELPHWNTGNGGDEPSLRRGPQDSAARVRRVLAEQLPIAATAEAGVPLLLLYLFYETERAWEISYHYAPMWDTLRGVQERLAAGPALVRPPEATAVEALLALVGSLDHQIRVENAMTCGRPDILAQEAAGAARRAADAGRLAGTLDDAWTRLREFIGDRAEATVSYYQAVATAGNHLQAFLADGAELQPAITALQVAEANGNADHYDLSELKAHRFSLAELGRAQRGREWLWIDHGKIVYVYPFALRGLAPAEAVERTRNEAYRWLLNSVPAAGVRDKLQLDDVWDGSDFVGRQYEGALVELPGVTISDSDGKELATLSAELRLSVLGNHYVRLEAELVDAPPSEVYAAMFRAAPEHGYVRVYFNGHQPGEAHPRLSDLAVRLAQGVSSNLGGEQAGVSAVARPGMFHVLVSVHAASLSDGYDPGAQRREARTVDEIARAVGAGVLSNPVTHCVGSLAEWIRYPSTLDQPGIGVSLAGEHLRRTCNTTVLVALGSPEFSTATRETTAEFVASLDGLFAGWFSELARYHRSVSELIPDLDRFADAATGLTAAKLGALAGDLEQQQIQLHNFATEARSVAALVESPSLVSSPVVATTLAALREAAGYPRQVAELGAKIEEVLDERLGLRIEALARRRAEDEARAQEKAERRRRARLDTLLAIIAAIGVSGLGQIIQAGYGFQVEGSVWLVVAITLLAAVVGVAVWRLAGRSHPAEEPHASAAPADGSAGIAPQPRQPVNPVVPTRTAVGRHPVNARDGL